MKMGVTNKFSDISPELEGCLTSVLRLLFSIVASVAPSNRRAGKYIVIQKDFDAIIIIIISD